MRFHFDIRWQMPEASSRAAMKNERSRKGPEYGLEKSINSLLEAIGLMSALSAR